MNAKKLLPELKGWFDHYTRHFFSDDPTTQDAMALKVAHTYRVCDLIVDIGKSLDLPGESLCIAETAALLHDVGRFEQFQRYRTFSDGKSENHAQLGVTVIQRNRILTALDAPAAEIVLRAVALHNRFALPEDEEERTLFFVKLLRDADKLDIWKVVTEYYENKEQARNRSIELDLPDIDCISDPVYDALINGSLVNMADLRTLTDFKLLQIGWVYDLNFRRSFQIARDRGYLDKIRRAISSESPRVTQIHAAARSFLEKKCA